MESAGHFLRADSEEGISNRRRKAGLTAWALARSGEPPAFRLKAAAQGP